MYNSKNRISAFIFIEDTFIQAETHTQCVINILIAENIVPDSKTFYKQMRDSLFKKYVEHLTAQIEGQSVFGEIGIYNGKVSVVVFDRLNTHGIDSIRKAAKPTMGDVPIYYLNLNTSNRILVELH